MPETFALRLILRCARDGFMSHHDIQRREHRDVLSDRSARGVGAGERSVAAVIVPHPPHVPVENLSTARSGVFHPASHPGDARDSAPPRGSQKPGTYYLYNNWDFNAAGAVFEKLTGRDIYDALETDLARPIGMQDFDRSLQKKEGDEKISNLPRLSDAFVHSRYGAPRIPDAARGKLERPPVGPQRLGASHHVAGHTFVRYESAIFARVRARQLSRSVLSSWIFPDAT